MIRKKDTIRGNKIYRTEKVNTTNEEYEYTSVRLPRVLDSSITCANTERHSPNLDKWNSSLLSMGLTYHHTNRGKKK